MAAEEEEENTISLTLALEGEALCRAGKFRLGVDSFLRAIAAGTNDFSILSAIYIQLGNAYFYLEDYNNALEYHSRDVAIARSLDDQRGEAKANGNMAVTLKSLGRFQEAVVCAQRQLDLYRTIGDDLKGISRALYNLGSIIHAKGKACVNSNLDRTELPVGAQKDLLSAVDYFIENYMLVKELDDLPGQGRVCGNLGNIYYLLGNFPQAVIYHQERLVLARECKDIAAERRAYTNLGNCHVLLGQYAVAEQHYLKALALVDAEQDRALQAQACYSLANTYTLMREHETAALYYQKHLQIAKDLNDNLGQARACWSLGAACASMGQFIEAIYYAERHLRISEKIGDSAGSASAEANLIDYRNQAEAASDDFNKDGSAEQESNSCRFLKHLDRLQLTPTKETNNKLDLVKENSPSLLRRPRSPSAPHGAALLKFGRAKDSSATELQLPEVQEKVNRENYLDEDFFEQISKAQSKRLDDQRCSFVEDKENHRLRNGNVKTGTHASINTREELMDFIAGFQSKRIDEQRAELPSAAGTANTPELPSRSLSLPVSASRIILKEEYYFIPDGSGLEANDNDNDNENFLAQKPLLSGNKHFRETLSQPRVFASSMAANNPGGGPTGNGTPRNTDSQEIKESLPDSFFDMLMKAQGTRMEDQRASVSLSSSNRAPTVPDEDFFNLIQNNQGRRPDGGVGTGGAKSDPTKSAATKPAKK